MYAIIISYFIDFLNFLHEQSIFCSVSKFLFKPLQINNIYYRRNGCAIIMRWTERLEKWQYIEQNMSIVRRRRKKKSGSKMGRKEAIFIHTYTSGIIHRIDCAVRTCISHRNPESRNNDALLIQSTTIYYTNINAYVEENS